ncbi:hypothetical protein Godav_019350 [Gossypium davidsonii]|uniref:Uncharacterized protein n=1 Tax=Gossypium davidsonii TaxID=34287 RepID=A0A7J8QZK0_GOSDV|nr:hypothetical protein [Gossypium davidsonii]
MRKMRRNESSAMSIKGMVISNLSVLKL